MGQDEQTSAEGNSAIIEMSSTGRCSEVLAKQFGEGCGNMTLDQLPIGKPGKIIAVKGEGALRGRLLDMGLTPRTRVTIQKVAPMGDPIELTLRGYELTLRLDDAKEIMVEAEEPAGKE